MAAPVVSVVIAVYNAEAFLRECLDSVIAQTIGTDRLEIIAVDDGSTDASGAMLDEYARQHRQVIVIHQENSGGPSKPRNVGIETAQGAYVFFLDSDDYLGEEALERMVAMAERNGSDIVLGKMVGVNGRGVPESMFRRNLNRADLFRDSVYNTLSPTKLFRRAFIERLALRFPEGVRSGEDQPFVARAYFNAGTISVVADYGCYYATRRPGHESQTLAPIHPLERFPQTAEVMEIVAAHTAPGENRDRLMLRHIRLEVVSRFHHRWSQWEPEVRTRTFAVAKELIDNWHTDWIQRRLNPWERLRAYCLREGLQEPLEDIAGCTQKDAYANAIVDAGRTYAKYPHFRDDVGIPDDCFDMTDLVKIEHELTGAAIDGSTLRLGVGARLTEVTADDAEVDIVLKSRHGPREYGFPGPAIAIGDLPRGLWDVYVRLRWRGFERQARLRGEREVRGEGVRLYATTHGNLSLQVGRARRFIEVLAAGRRVATRFGGTVARVGARVRRGR